MLLQTRKLTKVFGTLTACDAIDFSIRSGEIHALLGENGAGKSTLVKMLFGSLQPTSGQIVWQNSPVTVASPAAARKLGLGMVFQHFSLFDALTAAENITLALDERAPVADIGEKARALSVQYGLPVDPNAVVGDLSVGERQRIEIVRCLLQDPSLIILDEPTSVLTPQEADRLFETLFRLRDEGRSILYISHRLDEVRRICDAATILRHGKVVGHCQPDRETPGTLARMMVGDTVAQITRAPHAATGETPAILVSRLSQPPVGPFSTALHDVSLTVQRGEVVGIAGVAGNGQGELFDALSGEQRQSLADTVQLSGKPAGLLGVSARRRLGAAFVPEERLGHGAAPQMTLTENLLLSRHATDGSAFIRKGGVIARDMIGRAAARISAAMDVRKGAEDPPAAALSGGNLQKFLIGRELDRQPAVLIVNQPTWGVDAGAAARIRQALIDLARNGSGVLVISQDLDELFEISDRIAVIHDGALSAAMPVAEATAERIGLLMAGAAAAPGNAGVAA
ncbi:MAG: ABC transporter ATP-binding protein [Rhizobiaceae bacterium]|nr:ABC transporter ATP-binding protein [Rhizobiaceae bacterium]